MRGLGRPGVLRRRECPLAVVGVGGRAKLLAEEIVRSAARSLLAYCQ